jgi:hypothetical protein
MEKEPIKESNEFSMAELMLMHRALINEHINICLPPLDEESLKVATSASQKIVNLMTEKHDRQRQSNE